MATKRWAFLLVAAAPGASAAEDPCSCAASLTLSSRLATLEDEISELRKLVLGRHETETLEEKQAAAAMKKDVQVAEAAVNAGGAATWVTGRRLTSSSVYLSVPAKETHEFPSDHTCGTVGGYMQSLPVKQSGGVSWDPSPSDVSVDVALVNVANDWSTTDVHSHVSPLTVVHDVSCTTEPSLRVGLNATVPNLHVEGGLTVGGLNVADSLMAAGALTWVDVPLETGYTGYGETLKYAVQNGLVYMKGAVAITAGTFPFGQTLATLPEAVRPVVMRSMIIAGASNQCAALRVRIGTDGTITLWNAVCDAAGAHAWFDSVVFALVV